VSVANEDIPHDDRERVEGFQHVLPSTAVDVHTERAGIFVTVPEDRLAVHTTHRQYSRFPL
jgi:hypothetical protein